MPFTNENNLNSFFQDKLKPYLEKSNYVCERADSNNEQNLDRSIIEGIYNADIVIADLTRQSCNVFYELGISHTIPKKVLMITQDLNRLPFDVNKYKVIKYDYEKFNESEFTEELNNILSTEETNLVTDYKPYSEDPILSNFAINRLRDIHNTNLKRIVFIDLDGTLFNSYKHRTLASKKAFKTIFKHKTDDELKKLYESIYLAHKTYEDITGKNFRYDWCTKDIYRIAYLKERNINPKDKIDYLKYCLENIDSESLKAIEEAYNIFMNESFSPSLYARQFLEALKNFSFNLIFVTEGDKKVQIWKLEQLKFNGFFEDIHVGTPFENPQKLKDYIDTQVQKRSDDRYINALNIIYREYENMHDQYKDNFHNETLQKVLSIFKEFQLAVIGDRYNVDLKPYEKIDEKNILRIAIVKESKYKNQTLHDIKSLPIEKKPIIVDDLSEALELLINPNTWKDLMSITSIPSTTTSTSDSKKMVIQQVEKARKTIIDNKDHNDPFIKYADEIKNYYSKR